MTGVLASLIVTSEGVCQCTNVDGVRFNDDANHYGYYGFPDGVHCGGPESEGGCANYCNIHLTDATICETCCICCCGNNNANAPVAFVDECPRRLSDWSQKKAPYHKRYYLIVQSLSIFHFALLSEIDSRINRNFHIYFSLSTAHFLFLMHFYVSALSPFNSYYMFYPFSV